MPDLKKQLEVLQDNLKEFLKQNGEPPHIIAMISGIADLEEHVHQFVATCFVSGKLLLPHFEMMIGGLFAAMANNDHDKAAELLNIAARSTHKTIDAAHAENVSGPRPQDLN